MDAQDFRSLQEAYMEVVENQQLDEEYKDLGDKAKNKSQQLSKQLERTASWTIDGKNLRRRKDKTFAVSLFHSPKASQQKSAENRKRGEEKRTQKEEVDIYDLILSHLLDEGYAETQEAAEAIMVNMSEDWRESILG